MRFDEGIKLDFQDVLLRPKRSTISSRAEIDLERTFKFKYYGYTLKCIPIISSNMTSVTTPEVVREMNRANMLACLPKSSHLTESFAIKSIGLKETASFSTMLCLDVANGYIEKVVDKIKFLRNDILKDEGILIAGNMVTPEMTEAYILAGADVVKVGLGSGSACATRVKTGIGYPQLSAVMECADAAHGLGGHIISDGGCTEVGDIVKAFAGGADFVMLGGMLAGCQENGSEFYGMSSERANNEFAGGMKDYKASEGWEMKLPPKGPIAKVLQEITGGLRSACAYVGAKSLKDLPKCATFIRVNHQVNTSLWNYKK